MTLIYVDNSNRSPLIPSVVTDDLYEVMNILGDGLKTEEVDCIYFDSAPHMIWDGEKRPKITTSKCTIQIRSGQIEIMAEQLSRSVAHLAQHRLATSIIDKGNRLHWLLTEEYAKEVVGLLYKTLLNHVDNILSIREVFRKVPILSSVGMQKPPFPEVN